MPQLIDRLCELMNRHDAAFAAELFHPDYRSEQPLHPGRAFVGRAQVRANWTAMFQGTPDLRVELLRLREDDDGWVWTEWRWTGTRTDREPFAMAGVVLFQIRDDLIVAARLYMEEVDRSGADVTEAVEALSGRHPEAPAS